MNVTREKIDKNTEKLHEELISHFKEARKSNPTIGLGTVYEGWAIQKISSLQLLVTDLYEEINRLKTAVKK